MKVICFNNYYLPSFKSGGPVRSIANLVDQLGKEIEFHIITLDRDVGSKSSYDNIKLNYKTKVGNAFVYYYKNNIFYFYHAFKLLKKNNSDILYLNSFFSIKFSFYIIFLNQREKKGLYIPFFQNIKSK